MIALVLLVLSIWLLINFVGQVIAGARIERQIAEQQADNQKLSAENQALKDRVSLAESPAYAEQIAREQLGYAREGDTVIFPTLPDQTPQPAETAPAPIPMPTPQPNWSNWLHAFFPAESAAN